MFSELPLSPHTQERLASAGFTTPTPVQAAAIPPALEGKDVLGTAQTGTGKTLAFLLPIVEHLLRHPGKGIAALVLAPTRELAMQVAEDFDIPRGRKLGPAAIVVGGMSEGAQISALRRGARIVIATPGRLEDFLGRGLVRLGDLRILVLDEADRMLDMGFLPSIRRIVAATPRDRQTLCFSATMEASVAHLVNDYLKKPVRVALGSTLKPSENVRVRACETSADRKPVVLGQLLAKETGRCLVFTRTRRGAERLAKRLNHDGFSAARIHGDRTQAQRNSALAGFQDGRYRILVATDVAARGVHVNDIAHVINYDLPDVAENFIHRVGRTGRAGRSGVATTLFSREQRADLRELERTLGLRMEPMADEAPSGASANVARRSTATYERTRHAASEPRPRNAGPSGSDEELGRSTLVALPGEFLQAQM
jgi:ATP-dependent RNA helicase RhlE